MSATAAANTFSASQRRVRTRSVLKSRTSFLKNELDVGIDYSREKKSRKETMDKATKGEQRKQWTSKKKLNVRLNVNGADRGEELKGGIGSGRRRTFSKYVSDGQRIINVTFPDERRRTRVNETQWRVELLPFEFLGNKVFVRATVELKPDVGNDSITINAKKLEFEGVPKEFRLNETVKLSMDGSLGERNGFVVGEVVMRLDAQVNDFVALAPGLDDVVNSINDAILGNLQGAIEKNLIKSYEKWSLDVDDDADESAAVKLSSEQPPPQPSKRIPRF